MNYTYFMNKINYIINMTYLNLNLISHKSTIIYNTKSIY